MISSCVKVNTKLSMYPSTCDVVGSRHAALCQRQSLYILEATSIPMVVIGDTVMTESVRQSISSLMKDPASR